MRGVLISLAAAFVLAISVPAHAGAAKSTGVPGIASSSPTTVVYALQQTPDKTIDINITHSGGGRWYANPVLIGVGIVALIVILLLVVLAARGGGGTTIVKE